MNLTGTIQRAIGFFLLCVFAMGVTPKQFLHDALTNHQHIPGKEKGSQSVARERYSCDEQNLLAESPFLAQDCDQVVREHAAFLIKPCIFLSSYSFIHTFFFELRGPPAIV